MEITQKEFENQKIELSEHEKFVAMTKWLNAIYEQQKAQTKELAEIGTILSIFLVIVIIGIVISACNAMM